MAYREIAELKEKLNAEKLYLEGEIRSELNFEEIVGDSRPLTHVLAQIEIVSPTDSTVLIQGETGTGKELVARAIHNLSSRRSRTFVKLNCAAIPTGLLESELFGHEKGAFTGAIAQKIGRFELAKGGTLFLDEVGDIPLSCSQIPARAPGTGVRAIGQHPYDSRRHQTRRGDEPRPRPDGHRQGVPQRSVLPAQRLSDRQPAAARSGERHSALVQYFTQKFAARMNKGITRSRRTRWLRSRGITGLAISANWKTSSSAP